MISSGQIKKIYATARELGIDNELLHTFIFNLTGVQHISSLTKHEAIVIIDTLNQKQAEKTGKKPKGLPNRITPEQMYKIQQLEKELGWDSNPQRLKGFIRKYAKIDILHWLTPYQASNVIEGLKKILEKSKNSQMNCQKSI